VGHTGKNSFPWLATECQVFESDVRSIYCDVSRGLLSGLVTRMIARETRSCTVLI
jgi:hypothetical protein